MPYMYEKTATPRDGLRLHLNECTMGCSPAVVQVLQHLTSEDIGYYPDYSAAIAACARYLGVRGEDVLLTNGLDEGILALSVRALRGSPGLEPREAVVVVPAFDMYAASADAAGGRVVEIPLRANFDFPLEEVLRAISPRTRVVYITDPNNPTGRSVPAEAIETIAAAAWQALVFVDEAYVEFRGGGAIDRARLDAHPNILIGRTFAKAHGLAGLRVGALVGRPHVLEPIRQVVPPYSLNVAAAVALPSALGDTEHLARYVREVSASRDLLYGNFDRLGIPYWRSDANFVLADFGARCADVVNALRERRIYVRDRSKAPGCAGCVRITAGVLAHTRLAVEAIEEVLCAAQ